MTKGRGILSWCAYAVFRLAAMMLDAFPIEVNLRTARAAARAWWRVDLPALGRLNPRRQRDRVREHLRLAYGNALSEERIEELGRASVEHLAMLAVEVVQMPRLLNEQTWKRFLCLRGFDEALRALLAGKGAILITGHYGNWELTGYVLALFGFDITAVMRPLDNEYLNEYLVAVRGRKGLRLLYKKGASEVAEEILRDGGAIGFIADQNAGSRGLFVDFFGRPASTYKSIGLLAMSTEVPIIIGYGRRLGNRFQYEIGVQRVIHPNEWRDRPDPLRWITQEYTSHLERVIRDAPEQYLWLHRRWKSQPGDRKKHRRPTAVTAADPSTGTTTSPLAGSSPT